MPKANEGSSQTVTRTSSRAAHHTPILVSRTDNGRVMKPNQIKVRRMELGLTVAELAAALQLTENELLMIEAGDTAFCESDAFEDTFAEFEERVFYTFAGA